MRTISLLKRESRTPGVYFLKAAPLGGSVTHFEISVHSEDYPALSKGQVGRLDMEASLDGGLSWTRYLGGVNIDGGVFMPRGVVEPRRNTVSSIGIQDTRTGEALGHEVFPMTMLIRGTLSVYQEFTASCRIAVDCIDPYYGAQ